MKPRRQVRHSSMVSSVSGNKHPERASLISLTQLVRYKVKCERRSAAVWLPETLLSLVVPCVQLSEARRCLLEDMEQVTELLRQGIRVRIGRQRESTKRGPRALSPYAGQGQKVRTLLLVNLDSKRIPERRYRQRNAPPPSANPRQDERAALKVTSTDQLALKAYINLWCKGRVRGKPCFPLKFVSSLCFSRIALGYSCNPLGMLGPRSL